MVGISLTGLINYNRCTVGTPNTEDCKGLLFLDQELDVNTSSLHLPYSLTHFIHGPSLLDSEAVGRQGGIFHSVNFMAYKLLKAHFNLWDL